ncbi:hypothetical protein [Micromonospora sp. SH-82]|uniref:hypothetical protein n=1 Tax=Micromonospora sp. SH-82 TaxID=3132938 RepID=UPI003EB95E34
MRRPRTAAPAVALTMVLTSLIAGATPAQADPPGGTLRGVYHSGDFCRSYGAEGVQNDLWDWWYCEQRASANNMWFLWTFTY